MYRIRLPQFIVGKNLVENTVGSDAKVEAGDEGFELVVADDFDAEAFAEEVPVFETAAAGCYDDAFV
jgi:hypothetical protein